jgi:60 kDa SS-A/Ro ribonucleoprotein
VVNTAQFGTTPKGSFASPATATNEAGGKAYAMSPEHALTQLAMTGTFNDNFYTSAGEQLTKALELSAQISSDYLAKLAIYAHTKGHMKDFPAFLLAVLSTRADAKALFHKVFPRVITTGKMVRNFVQIIRSGVVGRKSLGEGPKNLIGKWLNDASDSTLLSATVGNSPTLADIIRLSHPKASTPERDAFFSWILGKRDKLELLPPNVKRYLDFKATPGSAVPEELPYLLVSSLELNSEQWGQVVHNASWTNLRMNLNTFERNGVFKNESLVETIASKLEDPETVARTKVFPYQLLTTYLATMSKMPKRISSALENALQHALRNIPMIESGRVVVLPDVSGSMGDPITGSRKGSTTVTRCVDVAGLIASAFLAKNPGTVVLPFENRVYGPQSVSADNTVIENTRKLASFYGGGTSVEAPFNVICHPDNSDTFDDTAVIIMVSDYESWCPAVNTLSRYYATNHTQMLVKWREFLAGHPNCKLVCIDLAPNTTLQAPDEPGVLNIGGFSDETFNMIARFVKGELGGTYWVDEVKRIELV